MLGLVGRQVPTYLWNAKKLKTLNKKSFKYTPPFSSNLRIERLLCQILGHSNSGNAFTCQLSQLVDERKSLYVRGRQRVSSISNNRDSYNIGSILNKN